MNYLSPGSIQSLPVREALGLGLYRSSIYTIAWSWARNIRSRPLRLKTATSTRVLRQGGQDPVCYRYTDSTQISKVGERLN